MTAVQAVFAATVTAVVVAIGLVVTGVVLLAGIGWAFVTAGVLIGVSSVVVAIALLREPGRREP